MGERGCNCMYCENDRDTLGGEPQFETECVSKMLAREDDEYQEKQKNSKPAKFFPCNICGCDVFYLYDDAKLVLAENAGNQKFNLHSCSLNLNKESQDGK